MSKKAASRATARRAGTKAPVSKPRRRGVKRKGRPAPSAKSAAPVNRRKQPKPAAPKPPRPSLEQRARVAKQSALDFWGRIRGPAVIAGKVMVGVIVALGAVGVATLIQGHLRTSPAFAIKHLTVEGNDRLSRQQVLEAAGLALGQNVFQVAPEQAEARLERDPWIAEAHVVRKLPDTLHVQVREHRAAAQLALDGVVYLVSDEGLVFKRAGPEDPSDLPVITGVDRQRFTDDREFRTSLLLEVVALLHDYRAVGLWQREPIGEVHLEPDDGLSLYIGSDATLARLGRGPYRAKLVKLRRVLDRLARRKAQAAYVLLDNVHRPDRVTVALR